MDPILYLVIGLALGVVVGYFVGASRTKTSDPATAALLRAEQERSLRAEDELKQIRETARLQAEQDAKVLAEISPLQVKITEMPMPALESSSMLLIATALTP